MCSDRKKGHRSVNALLFGGFMGGVVSGEDRNMSGTGDFYDHAIQNHPFPDNEHLVAYQFYHSLSPTLHKPTKSLQLRECLNITFILVVTAAPLYSTMASYEVFSRIQPHEYLRRFLDQSIRPDGRPLDRFRKTLITTDSIAAADASAMVRLGGTAIVCGIKAEVCEPHVERPDQGYLGVYA